MIHLYIRKQVLDHYPSLTRLPT